MRKWMRRLAVLFGALLILAVGGSIALSRYAAPLVRSDVEVPLYTVGDANYAAALKQGKNIVKFGRLPFGVYPGGVAFDDPQAAREYLHRIGKGDEWGVYQLSGDFELDTRDYQGQRYTTTSLLVLQGVELEDGAHAVGQAPSGTNLR